VLDGRVVGRTLRRLRHLESVPLRNAVEAEEQAGKSAHLGLDT
jgi:hypothetical protein